MSAAWAGAATPEQQSLFDFFAANATTKPLFSVDAKGQICGIRGGDRDRPVVVGILDPSMLAHLTSLRDIQLYWRSPGAINIESARLPAQLRSISIRGGVSGGKGDFIDFAAWPRSLDRISITNHRFTRPVRADLSQLPPGLTRLAFEGTTGLQLYVSDPLDVPQRIDIDYVRGQICLPIAVGKAAGAHVLRVGAFFTRCWELQDLRRFADARSVLVMFPHRGIRSSVLIALARDAPPEQFALLANALSSLPVEPQDRDEWGGGDIAPSFYYAARAAWRGKMRLA
jgi:hypothetical protein